MKTAFDLLTTVAFLLLVLVGFASIIGASVLRERLARYFAGALFAAFVGLPALSMLMRECREASGRIALPTGPSFELPSGLLPAVVIGHVVAALLVIRRYVGVDARRRDETERDRARTRERVRLPPSGEERGS